MVLMYLKTWNTAPKQKGSGFASAVDSDTAAWFNDETKTSLLRALQHIRPQRVRLVHSPEDEHLQPNPRCKIPDGTVQRRDGSKMSTGELAYNSPAGLARHLGQMASSSGCLDMLREHEAHDDLFSSAARGDKEVLEELLAAGSD